MFKQVAQPFGRLATPFKRLAQSFETFAQSFRRPAQRFERPAQAFMRLTDGFQPENSDLNADSQRRTGIPEGCTECSRWSGECRRHRRHHRYRSPKIQSRPGGTRRKNACTSSPFFLRVPSGRETYLHSVSGGGGDAFGVRLTTGYILGIPPGCLQDAGRAHWVNSSLLILRRKASRFFTTVLVSGCSSPFTF